MSRLGPTLPAALPDLPRLHSLRRPLKFQSLKQTPAPSSFDVRSKSRLTCAHRPGHATFCSSSGTAAAFAFFCAGAPAAEPRRFDAFGTAALTGASASAASFAGAAATLPASISNSGFCMRHAARAGERADAEQAPPPSTSSAGRTFSKNVSSWQAFGARRPVLRPPVSCGAERGAGRYGWGKGAPQVSSAPWPALHAASLFHLRPAASFPGAGGRVGGGSAAPRQPFRTLLRRATLSLRFSCHSGAPLYSCSPKPVPLSSTIVASSFLVQGAWVSAGAGVGVAGVTQSTLWRAMCKESATAM